MTTPIDSPAEVLARYREHMRAPPRTQRRAEAVATALAAGQVIELGAASAVLAVSNVASAARRTMWPWWLLGLGVVPWLVVPSTPAERDPVVVVARGDDARPNAPVPAPERETAMPSVVVPAEAMPVQSEAPDPPPIAREPAPPPADRARPRVRAPAPETTVSPEPQPAPEPAPEPEPEAMPVPATPPAGEPSIVPTIDAEVELLRSASRAVHDRRWNDARAQLDAHARRFPDGELMELREANRVLVACASGNTTALADFSRRFAASPHLARLRRACEPSR